MNKPLEPDELYEEACIEAAELVGPNSPEYDSLVEKIHERLLDEAGNA